TENVKGLRLIWEQSLGTEEAQECTPIIHDGMMYVSTSNGPKYVHAFDAATGESKWTHEFSIPEDVSRYACCGIVNRGVSYENGKIFVGRLDGQLTALDAMTGAELWTSVVVDYRQGSVITSPPLVVRSKVIIGFGGGEYGSTSYLSAYDVHTGTQVWKSLTIPGDEDQAVADSWKDESWKVGGAAPWYIGSYDPELNLIYYGTSNPSPWNAASRGTDSHDYGSTTNLYSCTTLALDPDTGTIRWYYQTTPYDAWDYDGVNEFVLADFEIDGQQIPVGMKADRNGFFYVINRASGKLISAEKYVRVSWADHIDLATGKPVENPAFRLTSTKSASEIYPSLVGGKNWQPMAYNPNTGLVYIPANKIGMDCGSTEVSYQRGYFYLGFEWKMRYDDDRSAGEYVAWDPLKQQKVWTIPQKFPLTGGAMTTAGNLLFFGNHEGIFQAHHAVTGAKLWTYKTTSGVSAAPMTYSINGKQYVAIIEGRLTNFLNVFGGEVAKQMAEATPVGGRVLVFTL
ncbi:MAG: PQQ-dependent dehydrogenase, methanol/ethanol family, partial [Cyclobacteriaceae bacterium]|nr:PQQ-dependent dehydrogenase, methanol/ethanol family [Cyclobacteriaceae bacterium]